MNKVRIKNIVGIIFSWLVQDYSSINRVRIKNNVGIIFMAGSRLFFNKWGENQE